MKRRYMKAIIMAMTALTLAGCGTTKESAEAHRAVSVDLDRVARNQEQAYTVTDDDKAEEKAEDTNETSNKEKPEPATVRDISTKTWYEPKHAIEAEEGQNNQDPEENTNKEPSDESTKDNNERIHGDHITITYHPETALKITNSEGEKVFSYQGYSEDESFKYYECESVVEKAHNGTFDLGPNESVGGCGNSAVTLKGGEYNITVIGWAELEDNGYQISVRSREGETTTTNLSYNRWNISGEKEEEAEIRIANDKERDAEDFAEITAVMKIHETPLTMTLEEDKEWKNTFSFKSDIEQITTFYVTNPEDPYNEKDMRGEISIDALTGGYKEMKKVPVYTFGTTFITQKHHDGCN